LLIGRMRREPRQEILEGLAEQRSGQQAVSERKERATEHETLKSSRARFEVKRSIRFGQSGSELSSRSVRLETDVPRPRRRYAGGDRRRRARKRRLAMVNAMSGGSRGSRDLIRGGANLEETNPKRGATIGQAHHRADANATPRGTRPRSRGLRRRTPS